jgi:hypothetical protein
MSLTKAINHALGVHSLWVILTAVVPTARGKDFLK